MSLSDKGIGLAQMWTVGIMALTKDEQIALAAILDKMATAVEAHPVYENVEMDVDSWRNLAAVLRRDRLGPTEFDYKAAFEAMSRIQGA